MIEDLKLLTECAAPKHAPALTQYYMYCFVFVHYLSSVTFTFFSINSLLSSLRNHEQQRSHSMNLSQMWVRVRHRVKPPGSLVLQLLCSSSKVWKQKPSGTPEKKCVPYFPSAGGNRTKLIRSKKNLNFGKVQNLY